jgi:hypothetical protein
MLPLGCKTATRPERFLNWPTGSVAAKNYSTDIPNRILESENLQKLPLNDFRCHLLRINPAYNMV